MLFQNYDIYYFDDDDEQFKFTNYFLYLKVYVYLNFIVIIFNSLV